MFETYITVGILLAVAGIIGGVPLVDKHLAAEDREGYVKPTATAESAPTPVVELAPAAEQAPQPEHAEGLPLAA